MAFVHWGQMGGTEELGHIKKSHRGARCSGEMGAIYYRCPGAQFPKCIRRVFLANSTFIASWV